MLTAAYYQDDLAPGRGIDDPAHVWHGSGFGLDHAASPRGSPSRSAAFASEQTRALPWEPGCRDWTPGPGYYGGGVMARSGSGAHAAFASGSDRMAATEFATEGTPGPGHYAPENGPAHWGCMSGASASFSSSSARLRASATPNYDCAAHDAANADTDADTDTRR